MPYSNTNSNKVTYTDRDFYSLKKALINYAKAYFPTSYRDFNETSTGMMLIEMSSYVGDVLNFYIDSQFKEMLLPLAEERRNVVTLANTLGYKAKPVRPSYTTLRFEQVVGAVTNPDGVTHPNWSEGLTLDEGIRVSSATNSDVIFETLAPVDFLTSASIATDNLEVEDVDNDGNVTSWRATREVQAIGGKTKQATFTIGSPEKFLELTLPENNVIEVISVTDSNDNTWSEVQYLAQDRVKEKIFWSGSGARDSAYDFGGEVFELPTPYILQYKKTTKRFETRVNEDNTTTLIFGNGILKNGQALGEEFLDIEQVGLTIPGETTNFTFTDEDIDLSIGNSNSTLGEAPFNTTLTVKYRCSNGHVDNVVSNDLVNIDLDTVSQDTSGKTLSVTNIIPGYGGAGPEDVETIRHKALANFVSQNRCVTREDYEARVLSMDARFGAIAKVHVNRGDDYMTEVLEEDNSVVNIYTLSYDQNGYFTYILNSEDGDGEIVVNPIKQNLLTYLNEFKMITDTVNITDGYIINFGVVFDVVAEKDKNADDVKLKCIQVIKDYFKNSKMYFRQAIYTNNIINELQSLSGVKTVNFVELTQDFSDLYNSTSGLTYTENKLYCYDVQYPTLGGSCTADGTSGYNWKYNFKQFFDPQNSSYVGPGVVLPSVIPSVFELKYPNINIRGIVR